MSSTLYFTTEVKRILGSSTTNLSPGSLPRRQVAVATTNDVFHQGTQIVGTTAEQLEVGDCTDDSVVILENTSTTAEVEVGTNTGSFSSFFSIPAGETAILPRANALAGIYLKSDEANTEVVVTCFKIV